MKRFGRIYKRVFFCGLMAALGQAHLFSEVLFTPRAQANTAEVRAVMASWESQAAAFPDGHMADWMKKRGEPGYIGDITVDFDSAALAAANGALGIWNRAKGLLVLPERTLPEPYMSSVTSHEAAHAYFDIHAPHIDRTLPPRYAVAMNMIREINAYLYEALEEIRHGDYYHIKQTITELPGSEENAITYFYKLRKYYADTNPHMSEAAAHQAACNQFALGFLGNDYYINRSIGNLAPQFYELMQQNGRTYTPPVLNRNCSHYMANLDTIIMRHYLQTAMPKGVKLTLDVGVFMAEVSRQIDRMDRERAAKSLRTCADVDAIFARSIQTVESLNGAALDGGTTSAIKPETKAWLDALVGRAQPNPQVTRILRATSAYKDVFKNLPSR